MYIWTTAARISRSRSSSCCALTPASPYAVSSAPTCLLKILSGGAGSVKQALEVVADQNGVAATPGSFEPRWQGPFGCAQDRPPGWTRGKLPASKKRCGLAFVILKSLSSPAALQGEPLPGGSENPCGLPARPRRASGRQAPAAGWKSGTSTPWQVPFDSTQDKPRGSA